MSFSDRLRSRFEFEEEDLEVLEHNARFNDDDGSATNILALSYRFLGVARYLLHEDVDSFRQLLARSGSLRLSLLQRFDSGDPIDPSYVACTSYKFLLDSLASCDTLNAVELSRRICGREEIERTHDHPFDRSLGYCLRNLVLSRDEESEAWLGDFSMQSEKLTGQPFSGLVKALRGILSAKGNQVSDGLSEFNGKYDGLLQPGMPFHMSEDEGLNVWGLGVANLALIRDLPVRALPPLIPGDLLIV